jgi:glycosyltransferase involved in cell wall biosynthesis
LQWLDADTDGTVYAGLDLSQFSPDGPEAARPDAPLALYLGRLDEGKGLFDLLDAVANLRDRLDLHLWVVGDGELRADLETRAKSLGIAEAVEFVGTVPHSQVQEYYRAADVYCLPSYSEGFPLGNIEAMACKTPVVSTDIAPVREQITNGETGLIVEPGDVAALETELERLLVNPELRSKLTDRAYEWVQRLSWSQQASELCKYYQEAINKNTEAKSS